MYKNLQVPKNIYDFCIARDKALNMLIQAHHLIKKTEIDLKELGSAVFPYTAATKSTLQEITKDLDKRFWRLAFNKTGFMLIMDQEAKQSFESDIERNPPEFSEENIRSTFLTLAQSAEEMFNRGLINVFRGLSKHHKTNTSSPFKVNRKAILTLMTRKTSSGGLQIDFHSWATGKLNDIDRVVKVLSGCDHVPYALQNSVNQSFLNGEDYQDAFYRVKGFYNGNMHIEFLRNDILEKANDIIFEYYGSNALAS